MKKLAEVVEYMRNRKQSINSREFRSKKADTTKDAELVTDKESNTTNKHSRPGAYKDIMVKSRKRKISTSLPIEHHLADTVDLPSCMSVDRLDHTGRKRVTNYSTTKYGRKTISKCVSENKGTGGANVTENSSKRMRKNRKYHLKPNLPKSPSTLDKAKDSEITTCKDVELPIAGESPVTEKIEVKEEKEKPKQNQTHLMSSTRRDTRLIIELEETKYAKTPACTYKEITTLEESDPTKQSETEDNVKDLSPEKQKTLISHQETVIKEEINLLTEQTKEGTDRGHNKMKKNKTDHKNDRDESDTSKKEKDTELKLPSKDTDIREEVKLLTELSDERTDKGQNKKKKKKLKHKHHEDKSDTSKKQKDTELKISSEGTYIQEEIKLSIEQSEEETDKGQNKKKKKKTKHRKDRDESDTSKNQNETELKTPTEDTDIQEEIKLSTEQCEEGTGKGQKKKKKKKTKHGNDKDKSDTSKSQTDTEINMHTKYKDITIERQSQFDVNEEALEENEHEQTDNGNTQTKHLFKEQTTFRGSKPITSEESSDNVISENMFNFEIDEKTWKNISPETRLYSNGRTVRRLRNNWTDIFSDNVNEIHPGCVLMFQRHYVTKESSRKKGAPIISANAKCKGDVCTAEFKFTMNSEYGNQKAIVCCTVVGKIKHDEEEINRRHISGVKRQTISQKMKTANETFLENLLKADNAQISMGNLSATPTTATLRKMIQEEIKKEHLHSNVIRGLQLLKESYEKEKMAYIREISVDPFTVILISDEQIDFIKKHKIDLYIDATSSVIGRIERQKRPFLYSVVTKPDPALPEFSLGDMLTTSQNIPKIEYFFNVMVREVRQKSGKLEIRKIETDYSIALIQASLKTFNRCGLKEYINKCAEIILGEKSPDNMIVHHLCAAHMIQDFLRNLKKEHPKAKKQQREIAAKLFAMLQNSSTINEATLIFENTCKLFLSPYNTGDVQTAIKFIDLASELEHFDPNNDEEQEDTHDRLDIEEGVEGKTIKESSPFTKLFQKTKDDVYNEIRVQDNRSTPSQQNPFYSQEIVSCFDRLLPLYPMWSGLLINRVTGLTRDTNAPVEAWFKGIKHDMGIGLRSRPERFIMALRKQVHGRLRGIEYPNSRKPRRKRKKEVDEVLELKEEQWRKKPKHKKTPKYHEKIYKTSESTLLPTVMSWGGKSHNISLSNTCTIDNGLTILHLFSLQYSKFLVGESNPLCTTLLTIFTLMNDKSFANAKLVWVNFVSSNKIQQRRGRGDSLLADLYGDEVDFFIYAIDQTWKSSQTSKCTSSNCSEIVDQHNVEHGIHTG